MKIKPAFLFLILCFAGLQTNQATGQATFHLAIRNSPIQTSSAKAFSINYYSVDRETSYPLKALDLGLETGITSDLFYINDSSDRFFTFGAGLFASRSFLYNSSKGATSAGGLFLEYKYGWDYSAYQIYFQARLSIQYLIEKDAHLLNEIVDEFKLNPDLVANPEVEGLLRSLSPIGGIIGVGISNMNYFLSIGVKLTGPYFVTTTWDNQTSSGQTYGAATSEWQVKPKPSPFILIGKVWELGF